MQIYISSPPVLFGAIYKPVALDKRVEQLIPEAGDMIITDKVSHPIYPIQTAEQAEKDGVQFFMDANVDLFGALPHEFAGVDRNALALEKAELVGFRRTENMDIEALTEDDLQSAKQIAEENGKRLYIWG